jgi:ATP-binding cassette subfamily B protein
MRRSAPVTIASRPRAPGLFNLLGPYRRDVLLLMLLALLANGTSLLVPRLIASGIDAFLVGEFVVRDSVASILGVAVLVLLFTAGQNVLQTLVSEKVARDLRRQLADKLAGQGYRFIDERTPARLLTNLTSDIDAVKLFVSQVIPTQVTSVVVILGTAAILLALDWHLASLVLLVIPLLGGTFFLLMRKLRPLFLQGRENIDRLNRVIRENIVGAALIRVLDSGRGELDKFNQVNQQSRTLGLRIVGLFSLLTPIITFVSGMGTLVVVVLGGRYVTNGSMTLGTFTAFNSYLALLIFPILMIGFMSNLIAQASASHARLREVLAAADPPVAGTQRAVLQGAIQVRELGLVGKPVLRGISLDIVPGSRTAILGPTAAGKTQLLNLLASLTPLQSGSITYDGHALADLDPLDFFAQIGLVFQDSVLFSSTLRENIAFGAALDPADLARALDTAELTDFVATLPLGLDTPVSERGTSLSGGQKQRIMLARALARRPRILFLDDFTARVDASTEQRILANLAREYPGLTLVSITQKVAPVQGYDQIVLLMEGEVLARGTHAELLQRSPEYVQILESQRSTNAYELRA